MNSPARKNQRMRCKNKPTASNRQSSANSGVHEIKAKETELLGSGADEDSPLIAFKPLRTTESLVYFLKGY